MNEHNVDHKILFNTGIYLYLQN